MANLLFYVPSPLTFDDDFTGTNGDQPNTGRWVQDITGQDGTGQINDNKLRLSVGAGIGTRYIAYDNLFTFSGDLDVQVDWTKVIGPTTLNWNGKLELFITDGTNAGWSYYVGRLYTTSNHQIRYGNKTPVHTFDQFVNSSNNGKFRLTRVGTAIKGYHDVGSGWVSTYDNFTNSAGTIKVRLTLEIGENYPAATFDFDNLIGV